MTFITETYAGGDQYDVQYNNNGFLDGDDNLEWDGETLKIIGDLNFPFVPAKLQITKSSNSIQSITIPINGFGYKNGSYTISLPGGVGGSFSAVVTNNTISSVSIISVGSGYTNEVIDYYPDILTYGKITANNFTNGTVNIINDNITGVSNLQISDKITTDKLVIGNINIENDIIIGVNKLTSSTITTGTLSTGTITINNNISGVNNITCTGSATVNNLNINGLVINNQNISGLNNITSTGNVLVNTSITAGNVVINNDSISGVTNLTTGSLATGSINVNSGNLTIDNLGNLITTSGITVAGRITSNSITDGSLTITNGTLTGVNNLTASGALSLQGTSSSITAGSILITNNTISGLTNTATTNLNVSNKITTNEITSNVGSNLVINSSGSNVNINNVIFQNGKINATNVDISTDITFTSNSNQKIFSNSSNISIETPNGVVDINGITFDISGNINSVNDITTTGTIVANRFELGNIVIQNNDILGIDNITATDITTSGTLTMTGVSPSIDSTNKITISSGANPTIVNGVSFQEGDIITTGDLTANEIVSSGNLIMTSLTPTITSVDDISITSTGGFVKIGGITINNGELTDVKSIQTTSDIVIGGDLSLDGNDTMVATVTVANELETGNTFVGSNGYYINGTYSNAVGGVLVNVLVANNTASISSIVITAGTPDDVYTIPIVIPLLGRITSTNPIIITSTNGINIDTTTISTTGDIVTNSLTSDTININSITSDSSTITITNPGNDVVISGITFTSGGDISGVSDMTITGTMTSGSVSSDTFVSGSGTFTNMAISKIVVDDFTIGDVVFDNSNISNVASITCSGDVVSGNLDIVGTLTVSNINTAEIGGITFDNSEITATNITTTGALTSGSLVLTGGTKTMAVDEITNLTKISSIIFDGTTISGLTSLTSTGTITATDLNLSGTISASTISNPTGSVLIETVQITDGNIIADNVDINGDIVATDITTNKISSPNENIIITSGVAETVPVRLISTTNVANVPAFISGSSAGLTLTVDGIDTWTIGDKFLLASQTDASENDFYEIIVNVDPIQILRIYEDLNIHAKAGTSSEGTTNSGKTFISVNSYNRSKSGTNDLLFEESANPTLTVGGVGFRSGAIDATSIKTNTLKIGSINLLHTGTQSYSIKLPTTIGTDGDVLALGTAGQLEWVAPDAYTLGGIEGSIQVNESSAFAGSADLLWNNTTGLTLTATNDLNVGDLKISHDNTDAFITNQTGDLNVEADNLVLKSTTGSLIFKNNLDQQVADIDQNGNLTVNDITVGSITLAAGVISGVTYTQDDSSLVSKEYVDKLALGIKWVEPVDTVAYVNTNTATPPTSINGVTLILNTRVLLTNQSSFVDNGIYYLNGSNVLVRPVSGEFASGYSASGSSINVIATKESFLCNSTSGSDVVGTNTINFIKLVSGGVTTGKGISMSGNVISLNINSDQFEINGSNELTIKSVSINNLSANSFNLTGNSGVIVSNTNPKLGDTVNISMDKNVIMDLSSAQTITGIKTFNNGITVDDLVINSDMVVDSITASSFISGGVSVTDNSIYGLNDLTLSGNLDVSGTLTTQILETDTLSSTNNITISSNNGVIIEGITFNNSKISNVDEIEVFDNISTSNLIKENGDLNISSGSGDHVIINGVKIKDNTIYDVKGIDGQGSSLFQNTTGIITIGGPNTSEIVLQANDAVILGTNTGTVTANDLIVSNALTMGELTTDGITFTPGQTQTINKNVGTLAFTGTDISINNVIFDNENITGVNTLTANSVIVSGNTEIGGNLNVSGSIYSSTDLDIVSGTGIVNIGSIVFDNGVLSGVGNIKTNNIVASNTTLPSSLFTDSTVINIGGSNTTSTNIDSSALTVSGNVGVSGNLIVSGDTTLSGVTVSGDIHFNNDTITKSIGTMSLSAPLIDINGVKVDDSGNLELNNMTVSGEVNVSGGVYIAQNLTHSSLTIGNGTNTNTTTVEGSIFTESSLSTGSVQLNEIEAYTGSEMKILSNNETITIGGVSTNTVTIDSDTVNITGQINTSVVNMTISNSMNVSGVMTIEDDIVFIGNTANNITSVSDNFTITSSGSINLNNDVIISDTALTSTIPIVCNNLDTATINNVNDITSTSGITLVSPSITMGNIIINTTDDSISGVSKITTDSLITTNNVITTQLKSDTDLELISSGSITVNESIVISNTGEITGISSLLTNSLESSNPNEEVNVYTESLGTINVGGSVSTFNLGGNNTNINIGSKENTIISLGNVNNSKVIINSTETTVSGDIIASGNLILQGDNATISGGDSGQITINTGGELNLNGFKFYKLNGKAVIDYDGQEASNVALFDTTPGNVTIGGSLAENVSLNSKDLLDISSNEINITAETINMGSSGNINIESGREGINMVSANNVSIASNMTVSGDIIVSGNLQLTMSEGFEGFQSIQFSENSVLNANFMVVNDTLTTTNLEAQYISTATVDDIISVYSLNDLVLGGDSVTVGNTNSIVNIGSLKVENDTIYTTETLKINAAEIVLGNPNEQDSKLVVNKKVILNGGIEKVRSLKSTHMSTNYLRCNRMKIGSDPSGFYDNKKTTATFGNKSGDVEYTRMGNFVNISGRFSSIDKTKVLLNISNCPRTKQPTVIKIGLFPTTKQSITQIMLVDTETPGILSVRVFDGSVYRDMTSNDYSTTPDNEVFTFSGTYTTDIYEL